MVMKLKWSNPISKKGKNKKGKKKSLSLKEFYEGGIEESQKELLRRQWKPPTPESVAPENLILLEEIRSDNRRYPLEAYWSGKGYALRVVATKRYYFLRNPEEERPPFFESIWHIPHPSMLKRLLTLGFARKKVWIPTLEYMEGFLNPVDLRKLPSEVCAWIEDTEEVKKAAEEKRAFFLDFRGVQPDIASGVEIEMTTDVTRTGAFIHAVSQTKHKTAISIGMILAILIGVIVLIVFFGGVF